MDICTLKFTQLESEVFSLLCQRAGEKLSQREIAKLLKVSPTAISSIVKKLREMRLATVEKTKTINFISFNRDDPRAIELKRAENLKVITLSGLSQYLTEQLAGATVILFGSYSKGEDTITSDFDLAVIGRKEKGLTLQPFAKRLHRPINVNFYESWNIHYNLKNNILNGIILQGSVEL